MSSQKFSAYEREAIWVAHDKKCAYTREPLDVSSFHIDHVLPETLADNPAALADAIARLGLPKDFDVHGYGNLLPCRPGANLQKGTLILEPAPTLYFLGIAAAKRSAIETLLARIAKRNARGKALILLQQCLERGDLSASEVAAILEQHTERPDEIFALIEGMRLFADATEVRAIARIDIETLRDRPVKVGAKRSHRWGRIDE